MTVSVTNNGSSVAFMIHPRLTRGKGGEDVVPVFWSDNYFSLLPGEKKSVTVRFDNSSLAGTTPRLVVTVGTSNRWRDKPGVVFAALRDGPQAQRVRLERGRPLPDDARRAAPLARRSSSPGADAFR